MSSRLLSMTAGLLLLTSSGCMNHGCGICVNEPLVTKENLFFSYEGEFANFYSSESYLWFSDLPDAYVTLDGLNFDGIVRVRIYDGVCAKIFDETFFGNGGDVIYKSLSDIAFPGLWEVEIESTAVYGNVQLVLN